MKVFDRKCGFLTCRQALNQESIGVIFLLDFEAIHFEDFGVLFDNNGVSDREVYLDWTHQILGVNFGGF